MIGKALLAMALISARAAAAETTDPYLWLESVDSPRAMAWVNARNAYSTGVLETDPHYAQNYAEALAIGGAKDRIPTPSFLHGQVSNFWQDADHLRGIWRTTSLDDYRTATPQWRTILDIDALGKAEGKSWVFHGADCLEPEQRRCLIALSDGGEDATTVRRIRHRHGQVCRRRLHPAARQARVRVGGRRPHPRLARVGAGRPDRVGLSVHRQAPDARRAAVGGGRSLPRHQGRHRRLPPHQRRRRGPPTNLCAARGRLLPL